MTCTQNICDNSPHDSDVCHCQSHSISVLVKLFIFEFCLLWLTPWSAVLPKKITGSQRVKNSPHFMESRGSLPLSQVPATCSYPRPDQSSRCLLNLLLEDLFNIIHPPTGGLPNDLFLSCFPTKTLYAPLHSYIRATCPVYLILLDLITRIIFAEGYMS